MTVVADASLALKWVLEEEHTTEALALRQRWQQSDEVLVAPTIFRPEVTNVLHRNIRRGSVLRSDGLQMLSELMMAVAIVEPVDLYERTLAIAGELGMGATYDALYVALAEAERCELWTADRKLVRLAQPSFPQVRWIGEATS